jgi:hypothetical protein
LALAGTEAATYQVAKTQSATATDGELAGIGAAAVAIRNGEAQGMIKP